MVIDGVIMEGTPEHRIHSIIARSDNIMQFGTYMLAIGQNLTLPLVILRAWISGLNQMQCIVVTAIIASLYFTEMILYFGHLQRNWPHHAQRWTKMFMTPRYDRAKCFAGVDELVAQLRYLQQPREKTVTESARVHSFFFRVRM